MGWFLPLLGSAIFGGISAAAQQRAENQRIQEQNKLNAKGVGVDLAKLRRDAVKNGFNPLTILGTVGGAYGRVTPTATGSTGAAFAAGAFQAAGAGMGNLANMAMEHQFASAYQDRQAAIDLAQIQHANGFGRAGAGALQPAAAPETGFWGQTASDVWDTAKAGLGWAAGYAAFGAAGVGGAIGIKRWLGRKPPTPHNPIGGRASKAAPTPPKVTINQKSGPPKPRGFVSRLQLAPFTAPKFGGRSGAGKSIIDFPKLVF